MAELTALTAAAHKDLKVVPDCALRLVEKHHVVAIHAGEIAPAASSLPVFFTRNPSTGNWVVSAVTSLEVGRNLFVDGGSWNATFTPNVLRTHPLYLMKAANEEKGYAVGIDAASDDFSTDSGERLFEENGNPSLYLTNTTALLESGIEDEVRTRHFTNALDELGLFKSVDLLVFYRDGSSQTIKGLFTLDEEKVQNLPADTLHELQQKGYLLSMHASLISMFQMNALIRRHNQSGDLRPIRQIKLEVARAAGTEL